MKSTSLIFHFGMLCCTASLLAAPRASKEAELQKPEPNPIPPAVEEAAKSVACIRTPAGGSGSGFLIELNGKHWLVSNLHVVLGDWNPSDLQVEFIGGQRFQPTAIRFSEKFDVALVELPTQHNLAVISAKDGNCAVGQRVFAVGNPFGLSGTAILPGTVLFSGSRDGCRLVFNDTDFVQGNSGGPLLDENGCVVAVNSLINPADALKRMVDPGVIEGTIWERKGLRISLGVGITSAATNANWNAIRNCASDLNVRKFVIGIFVQMCRPDQEFWNYTLDNAVVDYQPSRYASPGMREVPQALSGIVSLHGRMVKTRNDFLAAFREAHNAASLGRPMDFTLKTLSFQEKNFRDDEVRFEKQTSDLLDLLDRTGSRHPIQDKDHSELDGVVKKLKADFFTTRGPLKQLLDEFDRKIEEVRDLKPKKR